MRRETAILLAVCAIGTWNLAQAAGPKNTFRFGVVFVSPTGDLTGEASFMGDLGNGTTLTFDGALTLEPRSATTIMVGYERRFSDFVGLEFVTWSAKHDVDGRLRGTFWLTDSNTGELLDTGPLDATDKVGDVTVTPVTAGINFHLTPGARADLYVGPFVAYVFYGDFGEAGDSVAIDDDFALGAALGLDVPVGRGGWILSGAVRYVDTEASPKETGSGDEPLEVKPWVLQVAAGYRFPKPSPARRSFRPRPAP